MKKIEKWFPGNTKMDIKTFLNDTKIDGELYAYLLALSKGINKKTVVLKKDIPTFTDLGKLLSPNPNKSITRQTMSTHFQYLLKKGYLQETEDNNGYYILNPDKDFFKVPLDTLQYLINTVKELVIKTYIYLGKCNDINPGEYAFTLKEICEHLGVNYTKSTSRSRIRDAIDVLRKIGLIDFKILYNEKKLPYLKLTYFTTNCPLSKDVKNLC